VLAWLSVWSEVQTCICSSWCHCHSLSLDLVKSRLVLPFWYRLTWGNGVNGCVLSLQCFDAVGWVAGRASGWEPVLLNAASPTVLHISGTVYLTSSLATWTSLQALLKRNSKRFITLTATRRSTWPSRLRFVILMTDTWRVKRCIII